MSKIIIRTSINMNCKVILRIIILIDKNEQIIEESGNILKLKCLKNILQDPKKH